MVDIAEFNVPTRIRQLLFGYGIRTIRDLIAYCRRELSALPGMGPKSLDLIEEALRARGQSLAHDPYGPYTCARHGQPRGDASLQSLFLCSSCAAEFQNNALTGQAPEYVGSAVKGYCLHCNHQFDNIRMRQWYLCGICNRVIRSIGRSVVADEHLSNWWEQQVQRLFPHLRFELIDPPELRPYDASQVHGGESTVDFICTDTNIDQPLFGIELKTGRGYVRDTAIGTQMGQFQLDHSDCDAILTVADRDDLPVYLIHAQVIDRASPPTVYYVAVGLWWTDLFSMRDHYSLSRTRPRENRPAAYFDTAMFRDMGAFIDHLVDNGPQKIKARMETEGVPSLYRN